MTRRDQKKKVRVRSFFFSATPTAEKKELKGLPFSKHSPYVSRVTEFSACLRRASAAAVARSAACCAARVAVARPARLPGPDRGAARAATPLILLE